MSATVKELQSFNEFVERRLQSPDGDRPLDELFSEWRACNPTPEELDANVRAVRASLGDLDGGETGRPIQEFATEFRQRNGI